MYMNPCRAGFEKIDEKITRERFNSFFESAFIAALLLHVFAVVRALLSVDRVVHLRLTMAGRKRFASPREIWREVRKIGHLRGESLRALGTALLAHALEARHRLVSEISLLHGLQGKAVRALLADWDNVLLIDHFLDHSRRPRHLVLRVANLVARSRVNVVNCLIRNRLPAGRARG